MKTGEQAGLEMVEDGPSGGRIGRFVLVAVGLNLAFAGLLLVLKRIIPSFGDEESDTIGLATIMDGLELRSRARAFCGGSLLTLAGGSLIDLRDAELAPEGARIQLRTVMGGTGLVVPKGWRVKVDRRALMGAVQVSLEEPDGEASEDTPTLFVDALALMGGIEVAHKPSMVTSEQMTGENAVA